ncbi:MAG TPA: glycosyltransferase [Polyangia bacterium]|nr:glycosyltransferase [Polyangia bacterium]
MLILHLESPNRGQQGDHVYRTAQPCRALGELENVTVVSGSLLTPEAHALVDDADVLVLCDVVDADFLPIMSARRRRRRLTVYEINDHFLAPQPWNPTAYLAANLISRSLSSQLARHADCLQLTVDALARRFGHLNARRAIFPNQLWEAPVLPPGDEIAATTAGPVRIGWGGSVGHREDIKWIIPVLRGILSRHPQVTLAIMGDTSLGDLFAWVPRGRFEFKPGGSIDAYRGFVDGLDIGLGPLLPTEFNRCRSDVKFLEYTAAGALSICSDLEPYRSTIRDGENGLLFSDLPALDGAIERALARPAERIAMARTAMREVAATRLEREHARDRLGFYLSSVAALSFDHGGRAPTPAEGALAGTPRGARTFAGARYAAFGEGEVESLLYHGLVLQQGGQAEEARRRFADAARLAPDFYVAHMFLAGVEPDAESALRDLRRAEELSPRSCNVAYLIGAHRQARGDLDGAAAAFERCREIAPAFGAAQCRLGELAEGAGDLEKACALYEDAALRNGSFALPVARLATIALGHGQVGKAVGMLEQSLQHDAELWLTNMLIGRGYVELRQFRQARIHLLRALDTTPERGPVLAQLAKAEIGLGNIDAARSALEELKRLAAPAAS